MAIQLNGIFRDKMVFQWGAELRIFGYSDKTCVIRSTLLKDGEEICTGTCGTEQDGSFLVCLEPVDEPGGPYEIEVFENDAKACTIKDVYAGEIWLAAGGGNMEYPLIRSEFAKFILPKIGKTEIRYYKVPYFGHMDEAQAKAEAESKWVDVTSETAGDMSAVAFYFAREYVSGRRIYCGMFNFGFGGYFGWHDCRVNPCSRRAKPTNGAQFRINGRCGSKRGDVWRQSFLHFRHNYCSHPHARLQNG